MPALRIPSKYSDEDGAETRTIHAIRSRAVCCECIFFLLLLLAFAFLSHLCNEWTSRSTMFAFYCVLCECDAIRFFLFLLRRKFIFRIRVQLFSFDGDDMATENTARTFEPFKMLNKKLNKKILLVPCRMTTSSMAKRQQNQDADTRRRILAWHFLGNDNLVCISNEQRKRFVCPFVSLPF